MNGNWVICENVHHLVTEFREIEIGYVSEKGETKRKFIRFHQDGYIELGTMNSPFIKEYGTNINNCLAG